jgi:hypothetical protein
MSLFRWTNNIHETNLKGINDFFEKNHQIGFKIDNANFQFNTHRECAFLTMSSNFDTQTQYVAVMSPVGNKNFQIDVIYKKEPLRMDTIIPLCELQNGPFHFDEHVLSWNSQDGCKLDGEQIHFVSWNKFSDNRIPHYSFHPDFDIVDKYMRFEEYDYNEFLAFLFVRI